MSSLSSKFLRPHGLIVGQLMANRERNFLKCFALIEQIQHTWPKRPRGNLIDIRISLYANCFRFWFEIFIRDKAKSVSLRHFFSCGLRILPTLSAARDSLRAYYSKLSCNYQSSFLRDFFDFRKKSKSLRLHHPCMGHMRESRATPEAP